MTKLLPIARAAPSSIDCSGSCTVTEEDKMGSD
jgi:hypothetical protein